MTQDLTSSNNNALVRKTDETIRTTLTNGDSSNFSSGTYTFYLTVRQTIPATTIINDSDSGVIIQKTVTVVLAAPSPTITADFTLSQTELDIEPKKYVYDVKFNDPSNNTTSISQGYRTFEVVADVTRRNT